MILKTGWTQEQYLNQPDFLIERIIILLNAESEVIKAKLKEAQRGQ